MALTLVNANLVRQQTYMINRNPAVFYGLKALFLYLSQNNSSATSASTQLQLVNIDGTSQSSDGGAADQVLANVACHLYAIYFKKVGSTATTVKFANSATATAGDGTDLGPNTTVTTLADEYLYTFPTGRSYTSGLTMAEDTTPTGTTDTLKANRCDGFVIIGS